MCPGFLRNLVQGRDYWVRVSGRGTERCVGQLLLTQVQVLYGRNFCNLLLVRVVCSVSR